MARYPSFFDELNQYTLADAMDAETVAAVEALHPTLEVLMHSREICRHHPDAEAADKTSAQKRPAENPLPPAVSKFTKFRKSL